MRRALPAAALEVGPQYEGGRVGAPAYEPCVALAEELDVPVAIHVGGGPPGAAHVLGGSPHRARRSDALRVEEVLGRHPRLRVYLMHFGAPLLDRTIARPLSHPQAYVDVAADDRGFRRAHVYAQLKRPVDAGFEERIPRGPDRMIWPRAVGVAPETIERAPFPTARRKRAILHDNAARFPRRTPERVARDHGRAPGAAR